MHLYVNCVQKGDSSVWALSFPWSILQEEYSLSFQKEKVPWPRYETFCQCVISCYCSLKTLGNVLLWGNLYYNAVTEAGTYQSGQGVLEKVLLRSAALMRAILSSTNLMISFASFVFLLLKMYQHKLHSPVLKASWFTNRKNADLKILHYRLL